MTHCFGEYYTQVWGGEPKTCEDMPEHMEEDHKTTYVVNTRLDKNGNPIKIVIEDNDPKFKRY